MSTYTDASLIYYPSGYKESKAYSLKPTDGSGDLDFTRASTATRVNEIGLIEEVAANVPRLDNSQGGCSTLLLEPQRTNFMFPSQDFNAWQLSNGATITSSTITSPSGENNAYEIQSSAIPSRVQKSLNLTGTYTQSLFVKYAGTDTLMNLRRNIAGDDLRIEVTSSGLTISNVGTSIISYSITEINNGWHRITATALNFSYFQIYIDAFDGNGSLYVWGAEVQEGSYPTSYIPTTTTAVTRVADSASVSGISSLINSEEGVLYAEMAALVATDVNRAISLFKDSNNTISIFYISSANTIRALILNGGATQTSIDFTLSDATDFNKIAFKYKNNDCSLWVNGIEVATDTSATMPTGLSSLDFKYVSNYLYGKVQNVMVFPTALSDADLIALTTL